MNKERRNQWKGDPDLVEVYNEPSFMPPEGIVSIVLAIIFGVWALFL